MMNDMFDFKLLIHLIILLLIKNNNLCILIIIILFFDNITFSLKKTENGRRST